ncbi:MAG: hypothetical protein JSW11_20675 [Candidatus Heimdallarchaeota archaeon]|nr:MAG: hypothetical protein JSW11_20675 [Candidatus Heimdallarchaeota archaeon]
MSCDIHSLDPVANCNNFNRTICSECLKLIKKPSGVFFLKPPDERCPLCYWDGVIEIMTSKTYFLKHILGIIGLSTAVFICQIYFGNYFLNISSWLFLGVQFFIKLIPQIIVLLLLYSLCFKTPRVKKKALDNKMQLISILEEETKLD